MFRPVQAPLQNKGDTSNVTNALSINAEYLCNCPNLGSLLWNFVKAFLQPPMEGIVLETYGCGNAPNNRPDLLEELRQATKRNVVILNCTQCLRGSVASTYATGQDLIHVGVVSGGDMTPEASLAKLSYVLGKRHLSWKEKKEGCIPVSSFCCFHELNQNTKEGYEFTLAISGDLIIVPYTSSSKSLIKMLKSTGPRSEPCGTPLVTSIQFEKSIMGHYVETFSKVKVDYVQCHFVFLEVTQSKDFIVHAG
ncbi:60 kDa lysophospholipase [Varanus komodoensis]|nr:60 kDa lysophospholipase [Varanus komodoensis]